MPFFRIDELTFGSDGKCWDHYPCTISYFSVHCYSFTETKMSLIWLNVVILGTCGAASDGNFVKRRLRRRFWKLCTRILNPGTRYSNEFHWLVWMIWCQDSSSGNGQQGACLMACLRVLQQLNIFRNMFRKSDIPSWDTMPVSRSSDNWIKKIVNDVD